MKPTLQLKLNTGLTLTPQLQQSIRLLQLSTLELNQEITRLVQENPCSNWMKGLIRMDLRLEDRIFPCHLQIRLLQQKAMESQKSEKYRYPE